MLNRAQIRTTACNVLLEPTLMPLLLLHASNAQLESTGLLLGRVLWQMHAPAIVLRGRMARELGQQLRVTALIVLLGPTG